MAVAHKSAISVGLLHIPVGLYKTTRDISISFNQLCKDTHERVKYKKYCPSCNKEVNNDDIIKGYKDAVWINPMVCIVEYMPSEGFELRQSVFKGVRDDKSPKECRVEG